MNKKGFVFVETIIITTVLTVALLSIYLTFTVALSSEKRRLGYDDVGYLYNTFFIEKYFRSLQINSYIDTYFKDNTIQIKQISCNDNILYDNMNNQKTICEKIFNNSADFGVEKAYITRYDLNDIKDCISKGNSCPNAKRKNIENLSNSMIYYIRTLSKEDGVDVNNTYRLIIEYKETEKDYENTKTRNGKCDSDYEYDSSKGKCIRVITKYYYSSIDLKKGG